MTLNRNELKIIPSSKSKPSLQWGDLYLHSRHDPIKEAQRQIIELSQELKTKRQLVIFIGGGLAYNLIYFCENYSNSILWFEPNRKIASLASENTYLKGKLKEKRVVHIENLLDDAKIGKLIEGYNPKDIIFCVHRASYTANKIYHEFHKSIENYLNRKLINQSTLFRFDKLWMKNILANFPLLLKAQSVKKLYNLGKGKACLICGAGPSLKKDIPTIQSIRNKVCLIAVDTALKPLLKNGIDPDIILSVDPQTSCRHFLEGYRGQAILVVDPACSYLSLRSFSQKTDRLFYFWSPFALAQCLFDFLKEEPGKISFGGSVSTNAYDLGVQMSFSPILLSGQDLAFTDGLAHVTGAVLEELKLYQLNRFFSNELHNYRQLSALPIRYLPADIAEEKKTLPSNDKLFIFYQWFQRRFASDLASGLLLYKLNPYGVFFSNIKSKKNWPKELAKKVPFQLDLPKKKNLKAKNLHYEFSVYLEKLENNFSEFISETNKADKITKAIQSKIKNNQNYSELSKELDKQDSKIKSQCIVTELTGNILQKIIIEIDENSTEFQKNKPREILQLYQSSQKLYENLGKSAILYKKKLKRCIQLLKNYEK